MDSERKAREVAARFLAYRARSRAEVVNKLRDAGFDDAVTEDAVKYFEGFNYIDDARFCEMYAHDARTHHGFGNERIRRELTRLGVSGADVSDFFEADGFDEQNAANRLLEKKYGRITIPNEGDKADYYKERKRAVDFLIRKGYGFETAEDAWRYLKGLRHERNGLG
jgi:regulatory protein